MCCLTDVKTKFLFEFFPDWKLHIVTDNLESCCYADNDFLITHGDDVEVVCAFCVKPVIATHSHFEHISYELSNCISFRPHEAIHIIFNSVSQGYKGTTDIEFYEWLCDYLAKLLNDFELKNPNFKFGIN